MSIYKLRAWPGVMVILCLLAGLTAPAIIPGDNKAFAQSTDEPDLVIESISWLPEAPVIGDTVTFTVNIGNHGNSQASASRIAYYIDDIFIETDYVNQVGANTTITNIFTRQARAGEHTITAVIDSEGGITEANEDNNEKTYAFSVLAADLAIDEITWTPENPSAGEIVTFTVAVKNRGNYRAAAFFLNLYIDGNPRTQQLVMPMDPDATANVTYTWAALTGLHNVRAVADILNQIDESDKTNNHKTVVYATATPDLVIYSITYSPVTDRTATSDITVTVTVKNEGSGTATSSLLAYYIDDACQEVVYIGGLSPGATTTKTFSQVMGGDTHTLKAIADADDSIAEIDETNNTGTVTLPALIPDLIIESISWSPSPPVKSHKALCTITVKNQGKAQAAPVLLVSYFNETYTYQNNLPAIPVGSTATATIPWVTQGSTTTVRAVVDTDNYVNESNESNNTKTVTTTFVDRSPDTDLIIEGISCTPAIPLVGDKVTITSTIKNVGPGQTSPFYVAYYIDNNRLDSVYVNQINAGATVTNTITWTATGGTHTIRAFIDCNNSIFETNETNNEMSLSLTTPAPDLTIESITWSPLVPSTGDDVTVTLTIKNQGDLGSGSSFVNYYVDNVYRGNHSIEDIAPGATVTRTFTWQAEAESLIFQVVIDKADETLEINESNNVKTLVIPAPDLIIEGVTWSPIEPSENSPVTFVITVRNPGNGPADASYLSCYIDDILQTSLLIGNVAVGASAMATFTWTAQPGDHIFKAIADGNDSITESDESNNEKVIDLSAPLAPMEATPAPEPEAAVEAEAEVTPDVSEPVENDLSIPVESDVSTIEDVEDLHADNTTDEEDIAADIGDDSSSGLMGLLMNKFVIFGAAGLGLGIIVLLLILRRRANKE